MDFKDELRQAVTPLEQAGLSQTQIAFHAGVSTPTLRAHLNGTSEPSISKGRAMLVGLQDARHQINRSLKVSA